MNNTINSLIVVVVGVLVLRYIVLEYYKTDITKQHSYTYFLNIVLIVLVIVITIRLFELYTSSQSADCGCNRKL
jgi:hypothetical protein